MTGVERPMAPPGGRAVRATPAGDARGVAAALAAMRGPAGGGAGLAAVTVPVDPVDPVALHAAAAEADLEVATWFRPADGIALVGIGRAWAAEGEGPARFAAASAAWRALVREARISHEAPGHGGSLPDGPALVGALGFAGRRPRDGDPWAPFGASSLVLPELLVAAGPAGTTLTVSTVGAGAAGLAAERRWAALVRRADALAPPPGGLVARPGYARLEIADERPGRDAWRRLVGRYAGAVGRGRLDKVVVARRVDLRSQLELDVPNALRRLAAAAPESAVYAVRRDGSTFLGATPERLVGVAGRTFRTAAIAGTIRRGADPAEDGALAAELLASEKDREEHAIVVAAIRELLAPVAATLEVAPGPAVLRLRFLQHLATEISGTVREGADILALAERLHPTPAVGGEPRDAALALIDEHEGFDRGWYAGPVGWVGPDGDGELGVALRCGVVAGTAATLFAGCGIVADSDPDREWEESRMKLRAVVAALGIPEDDR